MSSRANEANWLSRARLATLAVGIIKWVLRGCGLFMVAGCWRVKWYVFFLCASRLRWQTKPSDSAQVVLVKATHTQQTCDITITASQATQQLINTYVRSWTFDTRIEAIYCWLVETWKAGQPGTELWLYTQPEVLALQAIEYRNKYDLYAWLSRHMLVEQTWQEKWKVWMIQQHVNKFKSMQRRWTSRWTHSGS